jgi:type I restriction enzyme S subunit
MAAKVPEYDEDYICYLALHPDFRAFAEARMEGTSGRQRVSWQALSEFCFPFPHRVQRREIGRVLRFLDDKIAINIRINQTLEEMALAIFKSWFVDFDPIKAKVAAKQQGHGPLRAAMCVISGLAVDELEALQAEQQAQLAIFAALFPAEMETAASGEFPKGWGYQTLAQLTEKIGSGATPRGGKEVYREEGTALIRSQNVYDSLFVWNGLARISDEAAAQLKGVTVQENDVLLNITGASILRTCVVEPDVLPARVNQHVAIIRAKPHIPPRYLHLHLLQSSTKAFLLGLNAGASREAITKGHIESLTVLLPSQALLDAFRKLTDPLFYRMSKGSGQIRILGDLRDSLLPKLLSGEMTVQETVAEPTA